MIQVDTSLSVQTNYSLPLHGIGPQGTPWEEKEHLWEGDGN